MSIEAMDWAKQQTCGSPSVKAVLMEIANWTNPEGRAEFRLVRDIAHVVEMSERSVQRIIARLELSRDQGGLGLLQRVPVFGKSGVQRANGFVLVGFRGRVTTCHPSPRKGSSREGDKSSPTWATNCHREGDTHVTGEGDTGVTPYQDLDQEQDKSPPTPQRGAERVRTGSKIPDDWTAPAIAELPGPIAGLAALWPAGAYQAEAEAFHQHWRGNGRRKADWAAFWAARVQARHAAVLRDAKAGVTFGNAGAGGAESEPAVPLPAVAAKRREDSSSADLHEALARIIGQPLWEQWFDRAALLFEDCGLVIVAPTAFHRGWLENNQHRHIETALTEIGRGVEWMRFVAETDAARSPAKTKTGSGGKQRAR